MSALTNYRRIARAIGFIRNHASGQPNLEEIARSVNLSPYHFHRIFREWAGVTPKDFLQYISLNEAKKLLCSQQTIEEAVYQTGLSSTSRLHDLFVKIEGMSPGEFKNGGAELDIHYRFLPGPFGEMLIAATPKGICNMMFSDGDEKNQRLEILKSHWPNARLREGSNRFIDMAENLFAGNRLISDEFKLHIRGSEFQLKVWEALLRIPPGHLVAYSDVAARVSNPRASRAAGTAVAGNPVAWLIPCHRVIKKTGVIGNYRWGNIRKTAMIGWEASQVRNSAESLS